MLMIYKQKFDQRSLPYGTKLKLEKRKFFISQKHNFKHLLKIYSNGRKIVPCKIGDQ